MAMSFAPTVNERAALNFETSVECKPERLEAVMEGMAIYGEYLKELPTADVVTWEQLRKAWAIATADVAPVVHGNWIEEFATDTQTGNKLYYGCRCSECGAKYGSKDYSYCFMCGARMDSSETDEPEINPCRGCSDYDENGGCLSDGGCLSYGENYYD